MNIEFEQSLLGDWCVWAYMTGWQDLKNFEELEEMHLKYDEVLPCC